jgi:tRNA (guanine-N7-)-methyltransferase
MIREYYKKIWYKYLFPQRLFTVFLRGRIGEEKLKELQKSKFLLDNKGFLELIAVKNSREKVLEIGFGAGQYLIKESIKQPEKDFIGIELFLGGIYKVLRASEEEKLSNLFAIHSDIRDFLNEIPNQVFSEINILFPDPWPKKKHWKRRLLKKDFIKLLVDKIKHSGKIFIATDIETYKTEIESSLESLYTENHLTFVKILSGSKLQNISETQFAKKAIKEGRNLHLFEVSQKESSRF